MGSSIESSHTDRSTVETALQQLLHTAQANDDDPTGTYTVPTRGPDTPTYTVEITVHPNDDISQATASRVSYCLDCDWSVSTADHPPEEINSRIIQHAVETDHDIESDDRTDSQTSDSVDRPHLIDAYSRRRSVPNTYETTEQPSGPPFQQRDGSDSSHGHVHE